MDASRPGMDDLIALISSLPGVDPLTADATSGAPEIAWGDSFFYYDPDRDQPADRRMPFATIVTKDYPGFDTESRLDRPGVFRVNISVGRDAFARLLGYPPAAHAEQSGIDYAVLDRLLPHPVYAVQSWVSVLNPGPDTAELVRSLLTEAHARAMRRHRTTTV